MPPPDDVARQRQPTDDAERKRIRAADTARCRSRKSRGAKLLKMEVEAVELGLCIELGLLKANQRDDTDAIVAALSRLLSRALTVMLNNAKLAKLRKV